MFSPSADRNRDPILAALMPLLPSSGRVLEIASGTGQHVMHFAASLPHLEWQPTDPSEQALASIQARLIESARSAEPVANVLSPLQLDVEQSAWPVEHADVVYCANMIHIAPWSAGSALIQGAASLLPAGGQLLIYGPFVRSGVPTAPGNLAFDQDLRGRNPAWGIRHLEAVEQAANEHAMQLACVTEMPANNLLVEFKKG
ncbi:MAG: DUF938 domain-containing protein [Burkholderiaceae bacterium]